VNVALTQRPARLSMVKACQVLGLNRSTVAARRKLRIPAKLITDSGYS
jgi:hypothetical protein